MSGSSLDGLDIAYCRFERQANQWKGTLLQAETFAYSAVWESRLRDLPTQSALTYLQTHVYFGHYCASLVNDFIAKHELVGKVDFIASHGHTIFHDPARNYTAQIGDGAALAALTGVAVVADFRSTDVALGGEGAPLVPIGDLLLFNHYNYCLNLGGICNITCTDHNTVQAFDIAPCNQVLNYYANKLGFAYDSNGNLAAEGQVHQELVAALDELPFYKQAAPKSLANNFSTTVVIPLVNFAQLSEQDALATLTEHIAHQVADSLKGTAENTCLVTGGGAFNATLIHRIQALTPVQLVLPDPLLIQFKEAYIFAFLGLLRYEEQPNTLHQITGSRMDASSGCIYLPGILKPTTHV